MGFFLRRLAALFDRSSDTISPQEDSTSNKEIRKISHSADIIRPHSTTPLMRKSRRRFPFFKRSVPKEHPESPAQEDTIDSPSKASVHSAHVGASPLFDRQEVENSHPEVQTSVAEVGNHSDNVRGTCRGSFKAELQEKLRTRSRGQSPASISPRRSHKTSMTETEEDDGSPGSHVQVPSSSSQEDIADSPSAPSVRGPALLLAEPGPEVVLPREEDSGLRRTPDSGMGMSMNSLLVEDSSGMDLSIPFTPRPMLDNNFAKHRINAAQPRGGRRKPTVVSVNVPRKSVESEESVALPVAISDDQHNDSDLASPSSRPKELKISTTPNPNPELKEHKSAPVLVSPSQNIAEFKKYMSKRPLPSPTTSHGIKPLVATRRTPPSPSTTPGSSETSVPVIISGLNPLPTLKKPHLPPPIVKEKPKPKPRSTSVETNAVVTPQVGISPSTALTSNTRVHRDRGSIDTLIKSEESEKDPAVEPAEGQDQRRASSRVQDLVRTFQNRQS